MKNLHKPLNYNPKYYPFGSVLGGRNGNVGDYRFSINGQEKVDEISGAGNHTTAQYWEYDTRLGRRWNLDPVDQVSVSNYAVFYNNPNLFTDPLGNTATKYEDKEGNLIKDVDDGINQTVQVDRNQFENATKFAYTTGLDIDKNMNDAKQFTGSYEAMSLLSRGSVQFDRINYLSPVDVVVEPVNLIANYGNSIRKELENQVDRKVILESTGMFASGNDAFYGLVTGKDFITQQSESRIISAIQLAFSVIPYGNFLKFSNTASKTTCQILSWGNNAKGHLIKHADALGFGGHTTQQLQQMLPQLRSAANQLLNNASPTLTRVGQWHGHQNAIMYISNGKMLVTEANGTFITVINKTSNNWYQLAKPLR